MDNKLALFLIKGLKGINEITENIDFQKTTPEYINNQLKKNINNSFSQIKNSNNVEEDFFQFLKKNQKPLYNLKIFILYPQKEQRLNEHIDEYFKNVQTKHKEDKMFYFYFQLVLMEKFLKQFNKELPRNDLKLGLKEILSNQCKLEKIKMSKCLGTLENDSVEVMSEFGSKIDRKCKIERENLEGCVLSNFNRR